ncbi:hypothetical protein WOSG25_050880 [Weissella oryzae SG25]|uniref:Uncharacterized protein n=1 Tax=Weissella oryzae (strain DSM 25784 / JCM 18191 / LMG 30913 / SG25) TaxID=1329250 RepID=A0A069D0I7_WEIOS|nr:hypothetical protein WOSG25_050880 [Weissella oryzae SG25]
MHDINQELNDDKVFKGDIPFQFNNNLELIAITQARVRWVLTYKDNHES